MKDRCEQSYVERHNCAHCKAAGLRPARPSLSASSVQIPEGYMLGAVRETEFGEGGAPCYFRCGRELREPGFTGVVYSRYEPTPGHLVSPASYSAVGYACEGCTGAMTVTTNGIAARRRALQHRRTSGTLTGGSWQSELERADPSNFARDK